MSEPHERIIAYVRHGKIDDHLIEIHEAIRTRLLILRKKKVRELKQKMQVGSKVVIGSNIRPERYAMLPGVVLEVKVVKVLLDTPLGRVRIPISALDRVLDDD